MVVEDIVWIDIHYILGRLTRRFGSYFYCHLKFHHIATSKLALKANHALACIKRAFYDLSNDAFWSYIMNCWDQWWNMKILAIWDPHFLLDNRDWKEFSITVPKINNF